MQTPGNVESKIEYMEECANFRAGDIRLKAQNDTDVSAVFAAVCVHGFAYRIIGKIWLLKFDLFLIIVAIDVAKGEAMIYSTSIVREFKAEFPKARLVVAYDIACRMSSAIAVQTISISPLF